MTLGTFQPKGRLMGDKMDLRQYAGRPLLVRPMEYDPAFTSPTYPQPKPVVFCDVVDLITGQVFISTLWGAGAVVDNLADKVGTNEVLPVKSAQRASTKRAGSSYVVLEPLEGGELDAAVNWYNQYWAMVDQTRAQKEAASAVAAQAAPVAQAPVQQNFGAPAQAAAPVQPVAQAPVQQFQQPVVQAPVQQGFGAPQGVFTDAPPAPAAGAPVQFGAPQGHDPAAAAAALAHLNQSVPQQG